MSEINIKETRFIPDKPNVIKKEQIEVYIPTGGYKKPGIVSFDTTGFIVDPLGHVKLRRNSVRNISNFEIDVTTGILTVYYDDGTISNINIPVKTDKLYSRNNLITTVDIGPGSFILDDNTGHWFVPITNRLTGFKDDRFIASLELAGTENNVEGYYTVPDTLFKGKDGSLLISVDSEEEKDNFNGRLLLLGGEIFTDNQIVSMVYEPEKRLFTVLKTDGTRYYVNAISEEYLKDYVNQKTSSVYVAKGNIEFSKLPSTEELSTGNYLGFVYNVIDNFVADIRFDSVSYGKSFSAGTNIVVARNDDGTYQFDVLGTMGGMVDLSDYISNKGGTIHGGLIFDGVSETIYSSVDANEFKLANANKELSVNLSNITLYDVGTSTYIYVDYPTQSGRLIVDTDTTDAPTAGKVAKWGLDGKLYTNDPANPTHCTNKRYVDNGFVPKVTITGGHYAYGINSLGEQITYKVAAGENTFTRGGFPISASYGAIFQNGVISENTSNYRNYTVNRGYVDDTFLPLAGGTLTGKITLAQGDGKGIDLGKAGVINSGDNTVLGFLNNELMIGAYNNQTILRTKKDTKLKVQSGSPSAGTLENIATESYVNTNKRTKLYKHTITGITGTASGSMGELDITSIIVISTSSTPVTDQSGLGMLGVDNLTAYIPYNGKIASMIDTGLNEVTIQFHNRNAGGEIEQAALNTENINDNVEAL